MNDRNVPEDTAQMICSNIKRAEEKQDSLPDRTIPQCTLADQDERYNLMYRDFKIGRIHLPCFASPPVQLLMVSLVCFLCPGMFNALAGLGGGGKVDTKLADEMVS